MSSGRPLAQTLRRAWLSNGSLIILAATAFLLADVAIVYIAVRGDWAIDFTCCYQQAGQRMQTDPSSLYEWTDTYLFRYSPWAAFVFGVLAPWSELVAVWLWFAIKVVVVVAVAYYLARRWIGDARWLVAGMVLFFPPIWHDMALGNVSVFTVAVLAILAKGGAPLDAEAIALQFRQGLKVRPAIRAVLVSLARVGEVSTADGGRRFGRRFAALG